VVAPAVDESVADCVAVVAVVVVPAGPVVALSGLPEPTEPAAGVASEAATLAPVLVAPLWAPSSCPGRIHR
jgi:hypothetical protein